MSPKYPFEAVGDAVAFRQIEGVAEVEEDFEGDPPVVRVKVSRPAADGEVIMTAFDKAVRSEPSGEFDYEFRYGNDGAGVVTT